MCEGALREEATSGLSFDYRLVFAQRPLPVRAGARRQDECLNDMRKIKRSRLPRERGLYHLHQRGWYAGSLVARDCSEYHRKYQDQGEDAKQDLRRPALRCIIDRPFRFPLG